MRGYFFWKNNTTGIYKPKTGGWIPSQSVGSPDIFVLRKGTIYGLEVKRPGGKQSEGQIGFQKNMEKNGGIYKVVHSFFEVQELGL